MKIMNKFAFAVTTLCMMQTLVKAEGEIAPTSQMQRPSDYQAMEGLLARTGGVFGPNRRVITEQGNYIGVKGDFFVDDVRVARYHAPTGYAFPGSGSSDPEDWFNIANSKPTFYFGCRSNNPGINVNGNPIDSVEIDAGLQYEWFTYPTT